MAAAGPPVQYKTLIEVQATQDYRALNEVQQAVVHLLFVFYEKSHLFTIEEDVRFEDSLRSQIYHALKTLYHIQGGPAAAGTNFNGIIHRLIQFENDSFFTDTIGDGPYLVTMNAIKTLHNNQQSLPVLLPVAVIPSRGPNVWVTREDELTNTDSQKRAYDALNALDNANHNGITLDKETLRKYIRHMNHELHSSSWEQLQEHARGIPQTLASYNDDRQRIVQGVRDANVMLGLIPQERPSLPRGVKRPRQGGKQSSKRRTMRRQQYKRRRGRTLHRR